MNPGIEVQQQLGSIRLGAGPTVNTKLRLRMEL